LALSALVHRAGLRFCWFILVGAGVRMMDAGERGLAPSQFRFSGADRRGGLRCQASSAKD